MPSKSASPRASRQRPLAWILFYLLIIDVAANLFFAYPQDPRNVSPSKIQQYLEYGRSVEGKLARMTRKTVEESAPIVEAGWLTGHDEDVADGGREDGSQRPIVTFYGMSHALLLANEIASQDPTLAVRFRAAPQAVPTWSFTAYLHDKERIHSDVVVLAVMTQTISLLSTTSGTTMYFDGTYPYTWPRYFLEKGALRSVAPPFVSADGYREFFFDRERWGRYLAWLETYDKYYDPLLFRSTLLDRSCLVRLLRRSYALSSRAARQSSVYDDNRGFNTSSEEAQILEAIVAEFARLARLDGSMPVVFVVNNLHTGDRAFELLRPVLLKNGIAYLSSHELCPPNDPRNYLSDSHFQPAKNAALARAMAQLVHQNLARQ